MAQDGSILSTQNPALPGVTQGEGVAFDSQGDLLVGGTANHSLPDGSGNRDGLLFKYLQ